MGRHLVQRDAGEDYTSISDQVRDEEEDILIDTVVSILPLLYARWREGIEAACVIASAGAGRRRAAAERKRLAKNCMPADCLFNPHDDHNAGNEAGTR